MSVMKGDFLGFTFNNVHSSELGIMRVSDGSRYTENLLPTIQDKTTQIPGGDGTFYQGSFYTQKQISFPIVFDDLTEEQLRRIKVLFGTKGIYDLIFDEVPYKVYKVKVTGTPNLKYICFDKEKSNGYGDYGNLYEQAQNAPNSRIYKGEGQLSFVAYAPYAVSRFKYIDQYTVSNIPEWRVSGAAGIYNNKYDWAAVAGLPNSRMMVNGVEIDQYNKESQGFYVVNPGDLSTDFKLTIKGMGSSTFNLKIIDGENTTGNDSLTLEEVSLFEGDVGFQINTKLNLIEGIDEDGELTGTLYNQFITLGNFFKIPVTEGKLLYCSGLEGVDEVTIEIDYNYLYF